MWNFVEKNHVLWMCRVYLPAKYFLAMFSRTLLRARVPGASLMEQAGQEAVSVQVSHKRSPCKWLTLVKFWTGTYYKECIVLIPPPGTGISCLEDDTPRSSCSIEAQVPARPTRLWPLRGGW